MTPLPHPEESLSPPFPSFHILHLYPPPPPHKKKTKKMGGRGSQCAIHAIRGDVPLLSNQATYCSLGNVTLSLKSCNLFTYWHKKHRIIFPQTFVIPYKML